MKLEGIHHISAITGDAPGNVEFYTGVLGMRMVKRTVNQDEPTVYHLFYGDEDGSPGMDLTFFEYPGAAPGVAGAGMVHRIVWRVASREALDFWGEHLERRAASRRRSTERQPPVRRPGGARTRAGASTRSGDEPLRAERPEIPAEHALLGFDGVRAYSSDPPRSERLLAETLGFDPPRRARAGRCAGTRAAASTPMTRRRRSSTAARAPARVHHVAFAARMDEIEKWRKRVAQAGARPTPVIERFYFKSVYFLEPSGVLFEIATIGPGFAIDEDPEHLGERLSLPAPVRAAARAARSARCTPLPYPPAWRAEAESGALLRGSAPAARRPAARSRCSGHVGAGAR